MVNEQCTVSRAQGRLVFNCDPDPAVPILASDQARVFIEPVSQEQVPFDVHPRAGQWVAFCECSAHSVPKPNDRLVDRGPGLVDDSELLEEESTIGVCIDKVRSTVECTLSQLVVRVQKDEEPAASVFGATVARVRPLSIRPVDEYLELEPVAEAQCRFNGAVCRGIVDDDDVSVGPCLLDYRLQTATYVVLPVERWHDDREEGRSIVGGHAASI